MKIKKWYLSKTVIVGSLQLIAALSLFGYEFLTEHQTIDTATKVTLLINGVAMVVLRWLTDQPITSFTPKIDKVLRPKLYEKQNG